MNVESVSTAVRAPVSLAQRRLWFDSALRREHGDSAAYNSALVLSIDGPLDAPTLERALTAVVARHEVLRTTYDVVDGELYQIIDPRPQVELAVATVPGLDAAQRVANLAAAVRAATAAPGDLRDGPILRPTLFRHGNGSEPRYTLVLVIHHIATDGLSMRILARELSETYRAMVEGRRPVLAALPVQYQDHARWQRAEADRGGFRRHLAYWRDRLRGAPTLLDLPTDRPRPARRSYALGTVTVEVPAAVVAAVRRLAGAEGAEPLAFLLAAYQLTLGHWCGQDDLLVGVPVTNRDRPGTTDLIGFFVNLLPLRLRIDERRTFRDLLRAARDALVDAHRHQQVSFDLLVEQAAPERTLAHHPLVQTVLALTEETPDEGRLIGEIAEVRYGGENDFDLTLDALLAGDALTVRAHYARDLFDPDTVADLLTRYAFVLGTVAARPDARLATHDLLGPAERSRVLGVFSAGRTLPVDPALLDTLSRPGRDRPHDIAVTDVTGALTFADLHERSDRLAAELRALGAGTDRVVGVCLPRCADLPVALLAVLKAGAAYLPLDPAQPADRLRFMLEDCGAVALLTRRADVGEPWWPERTPALAMEDWASYGGAPAGGARPAAAAVAVQPDDTAYVIYTSGSTGRPKGVAVSHRGLANFVAWYVDEFDLGAHDRVSQLVNPSCDASLLDMVPALAVGARIVVIPDDDRLGAGLWRYFADTGVTISFMVTPALTASAASAPDRHPSLRRLLVGGERLPAVPALPCPLANVYGPTETTIAATSGWLVGDDQSHIGRPMANTRTYVLDRWFRPVPVGTAGELFVTGPGLARGYVGAPELTAQRFVPDPFARHDQVRRADGAAGGARMYRTGDRVRWTRDGRLEFLGRVDTQLKVRGFRVEPGEIEVVLAETPGVADAVVLLRPDLPGGPGLVAFCRPATATAPAAALAALTGAAPTGSPVAAWLGQIRQHAERRLPSHMVPSMFVATARFPLNANGKVDRAALAVRELPRVAPQAPAYVPLTGPFQHLVADAWRGALGVEHVQPGDNFFHLGGHSLLVVPVAARIEAATGLRVPLTLLFEYPVLADFADRIAAHLES